MNTDSFIDYMKTDDVSKDIAENIEIRFDSTNYNKKVIGLMKDELGGKIMTKLLD